MFYRLTHSRRLVFLTHVSLSVYLLLELTGCSTLSVAESTFEPRRLGQEYSTYNAPLTPSEAETPPPFVEPRGELTLRSALVAALLNNPTLAAFSWEVRAREARALQAGVLPNPRASLEMEEFGGSGDRTGFDETETTLSYSQLLDLGGKRAKLQRVATLERDLAMWDYEARRLDVFTAVAKAFVVTLAARERVTLAEEQMQLAEEALKTVGRQVKAGAEPPVGETRARVALASSQVELALRQRKQTAAQLQLAATWGSTAVTFSTVEGDLEPVIPPPAANDLLPHLIHNPDIARWRVEKEQRRAALELEQARQIPNVEVGAGVRYFNTDDTAALVFETRMPLMLFDRNQGGIQEAYARLAKADAQQQAAEIQSRAVLAATHQSLFSAFEQVSTLRDTILPQAHSAFEEVNQAYRRGLFRYLDVLDARRTLFELREQYIEALASYHTAAADVERLIAEPLHALNHTDETH